jgi:hypothetical protein
MTLETTLESRGVLYLLGEGANPVKRGQDGEPDRQVLWGRGLHFWIEWKKAKTGRVRKEQKIYAKYLRAIGDEVHFIDDFGYLVEITQTFKLIHGPATAKRDNVFNPCQ